MTEQTGEESQVLVDLSQAERGSPKPSFVTDVEETHEIITTQEDVEALKEEESARSRVKIDLDRQGALDQPQQQVNPLLELVPKDDVAEELGTSIKEIYMIPSEVRPEYEPAVVEKYRYVITTDICGDPRESWST